MTAETVKPGRSFWVIGIVALLWNLVGVFTYLMTVTMKDTLLANMSEAERMLFEETPAWITGAYAIAVFSAALASIFLLMRKAWAVPIFGISLVAILIQMGHSILFSRMIEVRGWNGALLPISVALIALFLVWYSRKAQKRNWIG